MEILSLDVKSNVIPCYYISLFFPSSAGFGQCPCPPLHLGLKNTPAVFSICWRQDLPEQERRGGPKEEAARKEETCPADTRAP